MKIYNTLSRQIEEVTSRSNDQKLSLYACGPTVYDYAHLGHMRKYTMDDVLVRVLRHNGFLVQHVMNITDVGHLVSDADEGEDKMEKGARQTGKSVWEVAHFFEDDFWRNLQLMNTVRPDDVPHATQYIAEQIAQVRVLEEKGFTYIIAGDGVYFDTSKDPHYGELARLRLDKQKEGARIGVVGGKRNPSDFALWKFSPTDQKRQMEWDSPWGVGFPGWHIECSAMSLKCVQADQLDIHTGGVDHVPVHHTNEIAQAENATGVRPFVRYWVHHNFLRVDGQKMSKSLHNFYRLDDIIAKGYSPMALKLLFLSAHYRDELNFTWESLAASQKGWEKLERKMAAWLLATGLTRLSEVTTLSEADLSPEMKQAWQQFRNHLNNDLHTAQALAVMWGAMKSDVPDAMVTVANMLNLFGFSINVS